MSSQPAHEAALARARPALVAGRLDEALAILQPALAEAIAAGDARLPGLVGRCLRLMGRAAEAIEPLRAAIAAAPGFVPAQIELGASLVAAGELDEGLALLGAVTRQAPQAREAWFELTRAHLLAKDPLAALDAGEQSLRLGFDLDLAATLAARAAGHNLPERALALLDAAASRQLTAPQRSAIERSRGEMLAKLGRLDDAAAAFEQAAQATPEDLEILSHLQRIYSRQPTRLEASMAVCERALALAESAEWRFKLGLDLAAAHQFRDAHREFQRALEADPDFLPARWFALQFPPSLVYPDDQALATFRTAFDAGVADFAKLDLGSALWQQHRDAVLGASTPFFIGYACDAIAEMGAYGGLFASMVATGAASNPATAERKRTPPGRRRIAIVSAHLRRHTVARLFVPLLEDLARDARLDLHFVALDPTRDDWSARVEALGPLHDGSMGTEAASQTLRDLDADVIVHLDVGMDAIGLNLAAQRLAPLQCAMWGHPVTSGLPTIDVVLSPDAMEPADADKDYHERLVRLPGMGHGFELLPLAIELGEQPPSAEPVLFCGQTIFKLFPEHDRLFARILAKLPDHRLRLIAHARTDVREELAQRMAPAFREAGADPDRQIEFVAFQQLDDYLKMGHSCALNLETSRWSGGMSALDLLSVGVPTLAFPGQLMRSRQSAAILERLGLPELIARDANNYVDRAVALASNPAELVRLRAAIIERRDVLYQDRPAVSSFLADFLATTAV